MKRNEVAKMHFLDTDIPLKQFKMDIASEPYVDKSMLIDKFHDVIGSADCYYCITRPRRFGKTMNANMLRDEVIREFKSQIQVIINITIVL